MIVPSRSEGMPLRLLEAQSCGLPAVVSALDGMSLLVKNGVNGAVCNPNDIFDFANKIQEYYVIWNKSPNDYYKLNKSIRSPIIENYNWEKVSNKIEKMFEKCCH